MKKHILLVLLNIVLMSATSAYTQIKTNRPSGGSAQMQGLIKDPVLEISPRGLYAQVDFVFTLAAQNTYSGNDSLEAVLNFDLPENSFVHNSWLWLDDSTIIQAAIIDKGRAIQIYEGIVKRRRDPSLLIKTSATSYQLNVYPLKLSYPRKVKITYSVPFNWQANKVNIPLPLNILNASYVIPDLNLKIKYDNTFSGVQLNGNISLNNYITSDNGSEIKAFIPANVYASNTTDFNLAYNVAMPNGIFVSTYQNTPNSGTYQLAISPTVFGNQYSGRRIAFMLDDKLGNSVIPFQDVIKQIKSFIFNKLNTNDSFNVFYTNNGTAQQLSPNWIAADIASATNALSMLPANISSDTGQFETLVKNTLLYCQNKPAASTNIVIISSGNHLYNQIAVDSMFNRIKAQVGTFNNKIHVINNSKYNYYYSGGSVTGNELLYNKLTLASNGLYFENGYYYQYPYYTYSITDINTQLSYILPAVGQTSTAYCISLPSTTGFTYGKFELENPYKYNTSSYYFETGKYVGFLQNGTNLNIQIVTPQSILTAQPAIQQYLATQEISKAWVNQYILKLESGNGYGNNTSEIIDSSIRNRVLCNYTAFLAIETGDTVEESVDENYLAIPTQNNKTTEEATVKAYPNPFSNNIFIECNAGIDELEVYDMMGKLVYVIKFEDRPKKTEWNGKGISDTDLPTGIYLLKIRSGEKQYVLRALKQ